MTRNPMMPVARWADESHRRAKKSNHYALSADVRMIWVTVAVAAPFVVCVVAELVQTADQPNRSYLSVWLTAVVVLAIMLCALAARVSVLSVNRDADAALIDEALRLCDLIARDRTMDESWRTRARDVRKAVLRVKARRNRYTSLPSVDLSKLSSTIRKLHEAAVALAHYQMLAGLSEHAEIAAREVDSVLLAYAETAA